MKITPNHVLFFALLAVATPGCARTVGSGKLATETRAVSGFHGIELTGSGNVIVTQGDAEGLTVEAEDNLLPLLETKVNDKGVLQLGFKPHEDIQQTKTVTFKVSAKTLDQIELAGSGDISCASLKADHLGIKLPGSGNIELGKVETGQVKVDIEGSGQVKLAGKATEQKVEIDGSGKYAAADLQTTSAKVEVSGSGDCVVAASASLSVSISGSGDVAYIGQPTVTKKISGSGSVHQR